MDGEIDSELPIQRRRGRKRNRLEEGTSSSENNERGISKGDNRRTKK